MAIDFQQVSKLLLENQEKMQCDEFTNLRQSAANLSNKRAGMIPWDWRYNATYWALDVVDVCAEIGYSIAWMRTFAEFCSNCEGPEQRSAKGYVSYYADNAATRISSCRDKIALLAWSYYCPFNPDKKDEILGFQKIWERLACPHRFGLQLEGHEEFLVELNKLIGQHFQQSIDYRHKKAHRMEPRVVLDEPENSDQYSYMFALITDKEIQRFDEELKEMYPGDGLRQSVRRSCFIDGVLFDRRAPKKLLWNVKDFDEFTHSCWKSLCDATAGSCNILLNREPLLSKDT